MSLKLVLVQKYLDNCACYNNLCVDNLNLQNINILKMKGCAERKYNISNDLSWSVQWGTSILKNVVQ